MFEDYTVSVKLKAINEISGTLGLVAKQFGMLDAKAITFQKTLQDIRSLGVKMALTGGALALPFVAAISKAKEYQHQLALMNQAGMSHLEIVKATSAAWSSMRDVPTASATEMLSTISHLRMVLGSTAHAIAFAPIAAKTNAMLSSFRGKPSDEGYELAKALELRGAANNPVEMQKQANMMLQAIIASGGKLQASDFLTTFKYAKTAALGWSDEFTYTVLPTLMQEVKGKAGGTGTAGTGLMSAFMEFMGGVMPQRTLGTWQKLGLLDPKKIVWTKTGSAKGLLPGAIIGGNEFGQNPRDWVNKILRPALVAAGYTTRSQQMQELPYLFPNRTASAQMGQFLLQDWKFKRDIPLIQQAKGLSGYRELLKTDPAAASLALQAQWTNLMTVLGRDVMPTLIYGTMKLVNIFEEMTTWMLKNRELTKSLVVGFAGLAAVLLTLGSIAVIAAGIAALANPIGLVVAGIVALGAALVYLRSLLPQHLPSVSGAIAGAVNTVSRGTAAAEKEVKLYLTKHGQHVLVGTMADGMHRGMSQPSSGPSNYNTQTSTPPPGYNTRGFAY